MNPESDSNFAQDKAPSTPPAKSAKLALPPKDPPKACNCEKSRCLKLYCECFSRNALCTKACNCRDCLNNSSNFVR